MNILVVNDDGINAKGLHELVNALSKRANVYVCAPDRERSGFGHSITVQHSITAEEIEFKNAKLAYQISGTPADCVKIGLLNLEEKNVKVDMIFSGINHGSNVGTDVFYSGTVSAALEGALCGIPSIAVSVDYSIAGFSDGYSKQYQDISNDSAVWMADSTPNNFEYVCDLTSAILEKSYGHLLASNVININAPDLPKEMVKGLKYTTLGKREYKEFYRHKKTEKTIKTYDYIGALVTYERLPNTIDVVAIQEGYASITPLHMDLTDYTLLKELNDWG